MTYSRQADMTIRYKDMYGLYNYCITGQYHDRHKIYTIFARSDAVATIYLVHQFCAASI